jgi:hypothetical protein
MQCCVQSPHELRRHVGWGANLHMTGFFSALLNGFEQFQTATASNGDDLKFEHKKSKQE